MVTFTQTFLKKYCFVLKVFSYLSDREPSQEQVREECICNETAISWREKV